MTSGLKLGGGLVRGGTRVPLGGTGNHNGQTKGWRLIETLVNDEQAARGPPRVPVHFRLAPNVYRQTYTRRPPGHPK
eukprot:6333863-Alexandrium_andersonii.AAC.1